MLFTIEHFRESKTAKNQVLIDVEIVFPESEAGTLRTISVSRKRFNEVIKGKDINRHLFKLDWFKE